MNTFYWLNLGINTLASLYIVATPIGNLKDITLRALETLAMVDIVAAEDTRVAQKLFREHQLATELISYHQHNASQRDPQLLSELKQGKNIALITDAGTPLISDPGHTIVSLCRRNSIDVIPVPGACASIAALSVNEFNITRYFYEGFLPAKSAARVQRLQILNQYSQAVVFYEAKHRIQSMLSDMSRVCGAQRRVMIARELTKLHEQCLAATLGEIVEKFATGEIPVKGEYVIVLEGAGADQQSAIETAKMRRLFEQISCLMSHKDAVRLACDLSDLPKNTLYHLAREYY